MGLALLALVWLSGCGGGSASPEADSSERQTQSSPPVVPPVASIGEQTEETSVVQTAQSSPADVRDDDEDDLDEEDTPSTPEPEKGSPQWILREITRLRTSLMNLQQQAAPDDTGESETALSPGQAAEERIRRLYRIIDLSTQVVGMTHRDESRQQMFNNAVHYLSDARMQLALLGDDEQAELLKEDAEALFQRDATSFAAVESASKVVQLVQAQAQQKAANDGKWGVAFARQARMFAERFPQESTRAGIQLLAAGKMCDNLGLLEEAKACLTAIEDKLEETPFAEQSAGSLRRLRLPGHRLEEFGGSTHDGGFVSIDQYHGKGVLIVFWASNSARFQNDLPVIQQTLERYGDRVVALGVNLDRDELAIDRFLESTGLDWKHIFYSDPEKRGAKNLVTRHYGVHQVPSYWLIDPEGIVRSIRVDVSQLDQEIASALGR
jgi:peroxiredoxin